MTYKRFLPILTPLAALLLASCTADEPATQAPAAPTAGQAYTYVLHLDMPCPDTGVMTDLHSGITRADGTWADGSQVQFFFYTEVGASAYKGVSGTAAYTAADDTWTLTTARQLPASPAATDCEARYVKPGASTDSDFLTAVYFATAPYTLQGDTAIYATLSLKPCNWRLRFQGSKGTQLSLSATNMRHSAGDSIHATVRPQAAADNIPLTIADDGYTPYVYGLLDDNTAPITFTVATGGEQYTCTFAPADFTAGRSIALQAPTTSNYSTMGWTKAVAPSDIDLTTFGGDQNWD